MAAMARVTGGRAEICEMAVVCGLASAGRLLRAGRPAARPAAPASHPPPGSGWPSPRARPERSAWSGTSCRTARDEDDGTDPGGIETHW